MTEYIVFFLAFAILASVFLFDKRKQSKRHLDDADKIKTLDSRINEQKGMISELESKVPVEPPQPPTEQKAECQLPPPTENQGLPAIGSDDMGVFAPLNDAFASITSVGGSVPDPNEMLKTL